MAAVCERARATKGIDDAAIEQARMRIDMDPTEAVVTLILEHRAKLLGIVGVGTS